MKRLFAKTALPVILSAFLLLGVGFAQSQSGTLEIAVSQSPVGLDPDLATAFSTFAVVGQIYEGLVELNADLQLEPALATSWTVSDDNLTYTFRLRKGVTFHNGRPMTSKDVVYSFDRLMDPKTGSPLASNFSQVASVKAPDDDTVVFKLKAPFAPFLSTLINLSIIPKEVVEKNGNLQKVAVGTGPFMLKKWVPGSYILLKANPNYYRKGEPGVAALKYNIVPEASTRAAGLRNGTYQFVPAVDPATAQTLRNTPDVTLLHTQDLAYSLLGLNVSRPPLNNPKVREAINLAVNRKQVIQAVYFGNAVPGGPLSPALKDWAVSTDHFECYKSDPAKAKELLAEAGYPNGFDMKIIDYSTLKVVSDLAQVLQAELKSVGINATVDTQEFGNFVQNWKNSNFDAFVSLNGGSVDPDGYLYRTFHTGGATNVFKYSNPEVDKLLDEGRRTTDKQKRYDIYAQLQDTLACQGPIVHVAYGTLFAAERDNVQGFKQIPTRSLLYLRDVTLK
jgi:peptide/nickel transport system substrate-binding protein